MTNGDNPFKVKSQVQRGGKPSFRSREDRQDTPTLDVHGIVFVDIKANLFDEIARETAKTLAGSERKFNKPSQIRKFYDELTMWEMRVAQQPDRFNEYLPFIRMLNAKAAYAKGRELVDANFEAFINRCVGQVESKETLRICKLFFEAFLGFYRELRPSDR
jgi:CRISPR-associated protein Csm2